ncbi:MAG: NapC/NirT family cytochrome c [Candidatus Thiodiazotropha sp.]
MSKFRLPIVISREVFYALVIGGMAGISLILFLIEFDELTSTEQFCTSCHSMELAALPYRESTHYLPVSGVRASCGDCHVSEGVFAATWDHIKGGKDLMAQMIGPDYDDPVINALHLPDAAFRARQWFRETDSATCKRCHEITAIQGKRSNTLAIHLEETEDKTCIDCHINLVHRHVPDEHTFKRAAWNQMVEQEYGLEAGSAERMLEQ